MSEIELAIETGKVAFAPSHAPACGPMGEYCLHLQVPRGTHGVYIDGLKIRTRKGLRYRVHRIIVPFDGIEPTGATLRVADLVCTDRWLVVGDLLFLHERDKRGAERSDCPYNRAMAAIRRGHNLGGPYETAGAAGVVLRVGCKEARIPIEVLIRDSRLQRLTIDVAASSLHDESEVD